MSTAVTDDPQQNRFEVRVEDELAGVLEYERGGSELVLVHTEVFDAYGGRGLGAQLVRAAVDQARQDGLRVVPVCPYARAWLARYAE